MPPLKIFKQLLWWIRASQPANAGDVGSVPGLGRSPGVGNGNRLQYSCRENPWTEEPSGLQSMGSQTVEKD